MTQESKKPIPEHRQQAINVLAVLNISIDVGSSIRRKMIHDELENKLANLWCTFSNQSLLISRSDFMAFCQGLMIADAIDADTFGRLHDTCKQVSSIISAKIGEEQDDQ